MLISDYITPILYRDANGNYPVRYDSRDNSSYTKNTNDKLSSNMYSIDDYFKISLSSSLTKTLRIIPENYKVFDWETRQDRILTTSIVVGVFFFFQTFKYIKLGIKVISIGNIIGSAAVCIGAFIFFAAITYVILDNIVPEY